MLAITHLLTDIIEPRHETVALLQSTPLAFQYGPDYCAQCLRINFVSLLILRFSGLKKTPNRFFGAIGQPSIARDGEDGRRRRRQVIEGVHQYKVEHDIIKIALQRKCINF